MQRKSTHGLRLDQLAELLRAASAEADHVMAGIPEEAKPEPEQQRPPGESQRPSTNGRKTRDDGPA